MYLPLRHDKVASIIYKSISEKHSTIQEVYSNEDIEIWWDKKVKTLSKLKHNKPDIVYWNKSVKKCFIVDISVGLDINIDKNTNLKLDNYLPLASELKRIYEDYMFQVIPIVIGATGLVTQSLTKFLKQLDITDVENVIKRCQKSALIGTVKITKSFMKM